MLKQLVFSHGKCMSPARCIFRCATLCGASGTNPRTKSALTSTIPFFNGAFHERWRGNQGNHSLGRSYPQHMLSICYPYIIPILSICYPYVIHMLSMLLRSFANDTSFHSVRNRWKNSINGGFPSISQILGSHSSGHRAMSHLHNRLTSRKAKDFHGWPWDWSKKSSLRTWTWQC
jgi:hypothetical protein